MKRAVLTDPSLSSAARSNIAGLAGRRIVVALWLWLTACGEGETDDVRGPASSAKELLRTEAERSPQDNTDAQQMECSGGQSLVPLLDCVEPAANGMLRAYWSYLNRSSRVVARDVGGQNQFLPKPKDRGQPRRFAAGKHERVVSVLFAEEGSLRWQLDGRVASASKDSPRCASPADPGGVDAGAPADGGVDSATDGAADGSANSGPPEAGCEEVMLGQGWRSHALAVGQEEIFWTNYGSDTLSSVPVSGGPAKVRAALGMGTWSLAIDAANLYWVSYRDVMKLPLAGGEPVALHSVPVDENGYYYANSAFDIALDDSYLYYVDSDAGELRRYPLKGGAPSVLATGQVHGYGIAVDATNVYWTIRTPAGSVHAMPKAGGMPITLASGQSNPTDIAVAGSGVYWANAGQDQRDGAVLKVATSGGAPVLLASEQLMPNAIAVDAANVYWVNNGTRIFGAGSYTSFSDGTLMRVPLQDGTPVVLMQGQNQPLALGLDAAFAYWLNYGDDTSGSSEVKKVALNCSSMGR